MALKVCFVTIVVCFLLFLSHLSYAQDEEYYYDEIEVDENGVPICPATDNPLGNATILSDPFNCTAFYICSNGVAYHFACPPKTQFSVETLTCDWSNKVGCEMVAVEDDGDVIVAAGQSEQNAKSVETTTGQQYSDTTIDETSDATVPSELTTDQPQSITDSEKLTYTTETTTSVEEPENRSTLEDTKMSTTAGVVSNTADDMDAAKN